MQRSGESLRRALGERIQRHHGRRATRAWRKYGLRGRRLGCQIRNNRVAKNDAGLRHMRCSGANGCSQVTNVAVRLEMRVVGPAGPVVICSAVRSEVGKRMRCRRSETQQHKRGQQANGSVLATENHGVRIATVVCWVIVLKVRPPSRLFQNRAPGSPRKN